MLRTWECQMFAMLRKFAFAIPFGSLTAIATHALRFGDGHPFGGEANAVLVSLAVSGAIAIALLILNIFLAVGTTTTTGTIARSRVSALLPSSASVFAIAACVYDGIEALEGHGTDIGLATVVLAVLAIFVATALRRLAAGLAFFVDRIACDWIARLDARRRIVWCRVHRTQLRYRQCMLIARRFGRAPPNERQPFTVVL